MTFRRASRCSSAKISGSICSSSTSGTDRQARARLLLTACVLGLATGCGVTIKRDLSAVKPTEVVYDDLCGLQEYFDALKDSSLAPPTETFARDLNSDDRARPLGGRKRFRFD